MMFFKKKDPVCGMKEEAGKGMVKDGEWFCSDHCAQTYNKELKTKSKERKKGSCCH